MRLQRINEFGLIGLFFLASCSPNSAGDNSGNSPLNPNGDSELALLMRMMNDSLAGIKEVIKQGKLPEKFPDAFLKIHTAKPTDPTVKTEEFKLFADNYVEGLKQLYESPEEDLLVNYNNLVQRCVNCHQAVCPGPVKTIKKLMIDE